jgi:hypothetical protein
MIVIWTIVGAILFAFVVLRKNPQWPSPAPTAPMSDEEFIAACGPGTDPEVALGVRRIVSEKLCIPYEEIYPSHRFIEDLKAD